MGPDCDPKGDAVLSPAECRARAKECVAFARLMGGEHRRYLLQMARLWRGLAHDRELARHQRIDRMLKAVFGKISQEPVPKEFRTLLARLEARQAARHNRH